MSAPESLAEAERLMTICNACRYCEGLCAVFPAMEMRRAFPAGDLNYLANLCHSCGACFDDCQFSPPHEFAVNVPATLARVRSASYANYAWPRSAAHLFERNGLLVSLAMAFGIALFVAGFLAIGDPGALFAANAEPGAFYRQMPHDAMALLFGGAFVYAMLAMALGVRAFWRDIAPMPGLQLGWGALWRAAKDAATLRYLDGGGAGCAGEAETVADPRRHLHHVTFYGFLLCFGSTALATGYHYLLGLEAPYPWYDLPVLLGSAGGIGIVIGSAGLLAARLRRSPSLADGGAAGAQLAFVASIFLTALSGLALLALRATPAMGLLLALHLGVVFAFFVTMPYSRFVHGIYRFAALVRYALERRALEEEGVRPPMRPVESPLSAP